MEPTTTPPTNPYYIFIDIDGVFTTSRCLLHTYNLQDSSLYICERICPHLTDCITPLEKEYIHNLKFIIDQPQYQIQLIITSTWRLEASYKEFFLEALYQSGIPVDEVYAGDTPSISSLLGRGAEIREWMKDHSVSDDRCVIIDDSHEQSFEMNGLSHRFVKTVLQHDNRDCEGFNRDVARRVMELLT